MICLNDWETEITWPRNKRKFLWFSSKFLLVGHLWSTEMYLPCGRHFALPIHKCCVMGWKFKIMFSYTLARKPGEKLRVAIQVYIYK